MSSTTLWIGVLACAAGCYVFKIVGLSVPESLLERPFVRRMAALLPVALLSALVAVGTFATGTALAFDARALAVGAALIALLLRAPFLVVVAVAAGVAAGLRLLGMS